MLTLVCGNSETVFMDVYLAACPTGSSYFPYGKKWSAGIKFLVGSSQAEGQHAEVMFAYMVTKTEISTSTCLLDVSLNVNQVHKHH